MTPPALQWKKFLPALIVIVAISVATVAGVQALGGTDQMRAWVDGAGNWGPVVFVLLKAAAFVVAPLSGTPLILMAGAVFGVWEGLAYVALGELLGGCLNFWIARLLGRPGIRRFAGAKAIKQVDDTVEHVGGWRALLVASLVFAPVYDFVSYGAGLSNIPFRHFVWITAVGVVPQNLIYILIGDQLVSGFGEMYLMAILLLILGVVVFLQWWWRKPRGRR